MDWLNSLENQYSSGAPLFKEEEQKRLEKKIKNDQKNEKNLIQEKEEQQWLPELK